MKGTAPGCHGLPCEINYLSYEYLGAGPGGVFCYFHFAPNGTGRP